MDKLILQCDSSGERYVKQHFKICMPYVSLHKLDFVKFIHIVVKFVHIKKTNADKDLAEKPF